MVRVLLAVGRAIYYALAGLVLLVCAVVILILLVAFGVGIVNNLWNESNSGYSGDSYDLPYEPVIGPRGWEEP